MHILLLLSSYLRMHDQDIGGCGLWGSQEGPQEGSFELSRVPTGVRLWDPAGVGTAEDHI